MNTYVTPIKESNLLTDSDRLWASLMEMAVRGHAEGRREPPGTDRLRAPRPRPVYSVVSC
ncbi:hypothetical protein HAALTHF_15630n [Vreelandella aquamarina]|nr:hypothetical protein HAALTHF_15630n [Halomonas axialensis]